MVLVIGMTGIIQCYLLYTLHDYFFTLIISKLRTVQAQCIITGFSPSLVCIKVRILLDIQFMTQSMAGSAEAANALGKMPTITVRMAIAVIGILPLMIIFPFFQSYFARGMTVGAVKG